MQSKAKSFLTPKLEALTDSQDKLSRLDQMLRLYTVNPSLPTAQVAQGLGVSSTTVYSYLKEPEQAQVVRRNGDGVVILPGGYQ